MNLSEHKSPYLRRKLDHNCMIAAFCFSQNWYMYRFDITYGFIVFSSF